MRSKSTVEQYKPQADLELRRSILKASLIENVDDDQEKILMDHLRNMREAEDKDMFNTNREERESLYRISLMKNQGDVLEYSKKLKDALSNCTMTNKALLVSIDTDDA